jgi:adenosylhomocysteine nucleosidase
LKILVTFALETEFRPWRRLRAFEPIAGAVYPSYAARIGESDVRVILTGMGPAHARKALPAALEPCPHVCISSGLAGSLRPQYRCGEVLSARETREASSHRVIESDARLHEAAIAIGARPVQTFCTSDYLILTREGKRRMGGIADAVEMESFCVLAEASQRGVPAVAIRAISDSVDEELPFDFSNALDRRGSIQYLRVAGRVARAPYRLPALLRLGWRSRRAATLLARFLDLYVLALGGRERQTQPSGAVAEALAV